VIEAILCIVEIASSFLLATTPYTTLVSISYI
jgi:hypothetical protein